MNSGTRNVIVRATVIAAVVALLCAWIFWPAPVTHYECVVKDDVYRASANAPNQFVAASLKVEPQSVMVIGSESEVRSETMVTAENYAFKNHLKAIRVAVAPGMEPTAVEIARVVEFLGKPKNLPSLMIDMDGVRSGMLAAAYRLDVKKMPLDEVVKLAAIPDATPADTEAIRAFARRWAARDKTATTRPVGVPANPAVPAVSR